MAFRIENDVEFTATIPGGGSGNIAVGTPTNPNRRIPQDVMDIGDTTVIKIEEAGKHETSLCTILNLTTIVRDRVIDYHGRSGPENQSIDIINYSKVSFSAGQLFCFCPLPQPMNVFLTSDGRFSYAAAVRSTIFLDSILDIQSPDSNIQDGEVVVAVHGISAGDGLGGVFVYDADGNAADIDSAEIWDPGSPGNPRPGTLVRQRLDIHETFFRGNLDVYADATNVSRNKLYPVSREDATTSDYMGLRVSDGNDGKDYTDIDLVAHRRQTSETPFLRGRSYGDGDDRIDILKPVSFPSVANKTDVPENATSAVTNQGGKLFRNHPDLGLMQIITADTDLFRAVCINMDELKNLTPDDWSDGDRALILGRDSRGDTPFPFWYLWDSGTTTMENGNTVVRPIQHTDGSAWTESGRYLIGTSLTSSVVDTGASETYILDAFKRPVMIVNGGGSIVDVTMSENDDLLIIRGDSDLTIVHDLTRINIVSDVVLTIDRPTFSLKSRNGIKFSGGGSSLPILDDESLALDSPKNATSERVVKHHVDRLDESLELVTGTSERSIDTSSGVIDATGANNISLMGGGTITSLDLSPNVLTRIEWDGSDSTVIESDALSNPGGTQTILNSSNSYVFAKNIGGVNTVVGPGTTEVSPSVSILPSVSSGSASELIVNNFLSSLSEGSIADLGGQTIGIEGSIVPTVPNITIRNGTIMILPTAPDGMRALKPEGSIGASVPLLNDAGREDAFFEVADNSPYYKGQIVRVSADNLFGSSSSGGVVVSELAVVRGLDGSQRVLTYRGLSDNYRTSNNAKIEPLTTLDNIRFENIRVVGDGTARLNLGFEFVYTRGGVVEGCFGENVYARFCQFNCSHSFRAENNECEVDGGTSMYGFSVSNGSRSGEILNNKIYRSRHGFATAGGFVNRDVVVKGNSVYGATNAGLDAHGSSDRISYIENDVHVEGSDGTNDGLVFQGKNLIAVGNTFRGRLRAGIYHQSRSYDTEGSRDATSRICDNEFYCQTMTSEGIRVEVDTHTVDGSLPNRMTGVIISGNRINSARMDGSGISVRAHGNDIRDISIYGNTVQKFGEVEGSHGIFLEARGGHNIQYASITGGTLRSDGDGGDSIRLDGETSVSIRWGAISGVMMRGGNRAVNSINENDSDYFISGCSVDNITDSGNEFSLSSRSTVGDNNIG